MSGKKLKNAKLLPLLFNSIDDLKHTLDRLSELLPDSLHKYLLVDSQGDSYLLPEILALSEETVKELTLLFPGVNRHTFYLATEIREFYKNAAENESILRQLIFNRKLAEILESLRKVQSLENKEVVLSNFTAECPISHSEFNIPALSNVGNTYEWSFIAEYLLKQNKEPLTNLPCFNSQLLLNKALLSLLQFKSSCLDSLEEKTWKICELQVEKERIRKFSKLKLVVPPNISRLSKDQLIVKRNNLVKINSSFEDSLNELRGQYYSLFWYLANGLSKQEINGYLLGVIIASVTFNLFQVIPIAFLGLSEKDTHKVAITAAIVWSSIAWVYIISPADKVRCLKQQNKNNLEKLTLIEQRFFHVQKQEVLHYLEKQIELLNIAKASFDARAKINFFQCRDKKVNPSLNIAASNNDFSMSAFQSNSSQ